MLSDYDFRLILGPDRSILYDCAGPRHLDLSRKSSKQTGERENAQMQACESIIAVFQLPANAAEQGVCDSAFSKTKAKTTTKTV